MKAVNIKAADVIGIILAAVRYGIKEIIDTTKNPQETHIFLGLITP